MDALSPRRSSERPARGLSSLPRGAAVALLMLTAGFFATTASAGTVIFTDDYESGVKFTNPNPVNYVTGTIVDAGTSISPTHVLQLTNFPQKNGALYTLANTYELGVYELSFYRVRAAGYEGSSWAAFVYDAPSNPLQEINGSWTGSVPLTWEQVTVSTTITESSPALGKAVQFVFDQSNGSNGSTTSMIYLDNVSLQFTPSSPVPEIDPAGMGGVLALVTGALGLLERRRLKAA